MQVLTCKYAMLAGHHHSHGGSFVTDRLRQTIKEIIMFHNQSFFSPLQASLSFEFRMGKSTICGIVKEVSEAIWNALSEEYVKLPCTQTEWLAVSREYEQMWNFPNCLGAIDGKHVVIQALKRSGSTHYNYKGTHSIVLLAVCDAHYHFIMIDVGDAGHHSDSGVFSNSDFGQALLNDCLCLPQDRTLPGTTSPKVPYCFVGDEAFPLKPNMMRPYPGKNLPYQQSAYNYRLCRARRVIENSFGILAARWRIFRRPIIAEPENVVLFTKAAVALYNYLRTTESSVHCPAGFTDAEDGCGNIIRGDWRDSSSSNLQQVRQLAGNRYTASAASVREAFTD